MLIYTTSILRNCYRYFLRKSETEFTVSESLMSHHVCHHECQVINMDAEMDENGSSLENKRDEINCIQKIWKWIQFNQLSIEFPALGDYYELNRWNVSNVRNVSKGTPRQIIFIFQKVIYRKIQSNHFDRVPNLTMIFMVICNLNQHLNVSNTGK